MSINKVPTEILSQILSYVMNTEKLVYECMRVCRLWRRQIAPVLYEDIFVNGISNEQLIHLAQEELYNENGKIGDFVKTLTFGDKHNILLSRVDFEQLLAALPSLQVIQLQAKNLERTIEYMEYLDRIASRTQLQEVAIHNYIPTKENIKRVAQLWYSVIDQLKHQITTLAFFYTKDKFQQEGCQEILDYINEFANLKHLKIENTEIERGAREGLNVTSVLDACSNDLKSLNLETDFAWHVTTSNHKHHLDLTSLSLELPDFTQEHLDYLVKYAPNLKELNIMIRFGDNLFLDGYESLDPDTYSKFTCYLKQLDRFDCISECFSASMDRDAYWKTLQAIYNNQRCNLAIHFITEDAPTETLFQGKERWTLECQYDEWELVDVGRPFDFLNLNSIYVEYNVELFVTTSRNQNTTSMSDVLDFAISKKQIQAHISMDDRQIVLSSEPVDYAYPALFVFPKSQAPVRHAYFHFVYLNNHLLNKINNYYPLIERIKLVNCKTQEEDKSRVIDLQMFTNLQDLIIEFDHMLGEDALLYFHWINGAQETSYIYDPSINEYALFSTKHTAATPKDAPVIKIVTAKLKCLTFLRWRTECEIFC